MQKFKRVTTDNFKGEVVNQWEISLDRETARFTAIGIYIGIKFYDLEKHRNDDGTTFLDESHHNKFVVDLEYDYSTPEYIDKLSVSPDVGTYGVTLIADTLEGAIELCEAYLMQRFPGVNFYTNVKGKTYTSIKGYSGSISRYELAKKSYFKSLALRGDITEKYKGLSPLDIFEFDALSSKYANAQIAEDKYCKKIAIAFEDAYGFPTADIFHRGTFFLTDFKKKVGAEGRDLKIFLGKRKLKLLQKVNEYHLIIN